MVIASLFFYGWWNIKAVILLLISILINYHAGKKLTTLFDHGNFEVKRRLLFITVSINLLTLYYFKYTNFFIDNINFFFFTDIKIPEIILPLGISFFTFTQIAFLVDASRGLAREYDFIHYCLFVTYFPHLIAGPILHH